MKSPADQATILKHGLGSMQLCVPKNWTEEEMEDWANSEEPTGISSKWTLVEKGDRVLKGDPRIVQCAERRNYVHVVVTC